MVSVFWDRKGVPLINFLERDATIKSKKHCETLKKLRRAIQKKQRGKLGSKILFMHDNTRLNMENSTLIVLNIYKLEVFPHPSIVLILHQTTFTLF